MNTYLDRLKARLRAIAPVVRDKLRASPLLFVFVLTFLPVVIWDPIKVGLSLYGLAKMAFCAYGGYWCDRLLYPSGRPHTLQGIERGAAEKRRAFVVAAWIMAGALIP